MFDNRIDIALAPWDLTDEYNRNAGVVLVSLLEHCSKHVVAHILYDKKLNTNKIQELEYNKKQYLKIANTYNCDIKFHHVNLPDWIYKLPGVAHFTPGSLMRLCLPNLLQDIDSILYLDCDLVVLTDVAEIWNQVSDKDKVAARIENADPKDIVKNRQRYYKKVGINVKNYFNSGVLYLNLRMLRDDNFEYKIFEFLKKSKKTLLPDQDALNWYFNNEVIDLGERYNMFQDNNKSKLLYNNSIIHYSGIKPWNRYNGEIDDWYWEYLEKTPWGNNKQKLFEYVRNAPNTTELFASISKNIFKYLDGNGKDKLKFIFKFLWSTTWNSLKHIIIVIKREIGLFL